MVEIKHSLGVRYLNFKQEITAIHEIDATIIVPR